MIKYYNEIKQTSPEWFELRKGKLTASHATAIGANGKGLETYAKKKVIELVAEKEEIYTNSDMLRGIELEPFAAQYYEFETGLNTLECGFIENSKYKNCGCSPDRLIGEDGGIEIKARNNEKHFSLILGDEKEIPFNQIQMTLLVTEREWWDFVSYNPNFAETPIFIKRIYPDLKYFEKLEKGIVKGNELIEKYLQIYKNHENRRLQYLARRRR